MQNISSSPLGFSSKTSGCELLSNDELRRVLGGKPTRLQIYKQEKAVSQFWDGAWEVGIATITPPPLDLVVAGQGAYKMLDAINSLSDVNDEILANERATSRLQQVGDSAAFRQAASRLNDAHHTQSN